MKSPLLKVLIPAVAAAIALAGCSSAAPAPEPTATESQPDGPFTLRINWGGFPVTWAVGSAAMQAGHIRIPYETLLNRTPDGQIFPNLATEWEFGEGARSITLTLRDDVVFHDGEPFNAEAVATNIEYIKEVVGGQFGGPVKAAVESMEVVDEYTITINFTRPFGTFATLLTQMNLPMGSPAAIADGSIETHPVGTSPWAYDPSKSIDGTMMYFGQFDEYWGEMPPTANIELYSIPDDNAAVAAVINGEIDVTDAEIEQVERAEAAEGINWYQYPALRNNLTLFDRGPGGQLGDERVRQAICYAIDTDVLTALDPTLHNLEQHFIEGEPGYNPDISPYPHDLAKAEALLAEAGNPTVDLVIPAAPFNKQQVEVYAQQIGQLPGFTVTVQELPVPEYVATWAGGQYHAGVGQHSQITPQDWYGTWYSENSFSNPSKWASDELKALAQTAQQTPPGPAQNEAWGAVMAQIEKEALVCAHMIADQVIIYNSATVADVQQSPFTWEINLIDFRAVRAAG